MGIDCGMMIETDSVCPECGAKIEIIRVETRPVWSAQCRCSYLEHPHLTGITLRLKLKAREKARAAIAATAE